MSYHWTDQEKNFVAANAVRMKDADMAAALCRLTGRHISVDAVRKIRAGLGIKKKSGRGRCEIYKPGSGVGVGLRIQGEGLEAP